MYVRLRACRSLSLGHDREPCKNGRTFNWECKFYEFLKNYRINEILWILNMLMNFRNKIRYREKLDRMENFDANVLIRSVLEENNIVLSAEPTLAC